MKINYHFFIAHSAIDSAIAKELYSLLQTQFQVFLASESLMPGEIWDEKIPEAQLHSLISLIIVTNNTEKSFYQREEIAEAIELYRENSYHHKVIPIYIGEIIHKKEIPYGLRRIQGIIMKEGLNDFLIHSLHKVLSSMISVSLKPFGYLNNDESANNKHGKILEDDKSEKKNFEKEIKNIIKEHYSTKQTTYLIFIDLDNFNSINKRYGKAIGNKILSTVSEIIKDCSNGQYYKNISADEYIVCTRYYNETETIKLLDKINIRIKSYDWSDLSPKLFVTASIGYSGLELAKKLNMDRIMNEWIIKAIHGCFKAKKNGGNSSFKGPLVLPNSISLEYESYCS